MEVKKPTVGDLLLNDDTTFIIPPYQRPYRWRSNRWQALIQDILKKVTSPEKKHWLGIIITTESEDQAQTNVYNHKNIDIIDGQQRLVTLRIWLQAILDHAQDNQIPPLDRTQFKFAELVCQEYDKIELKEILEGRWRRHYKNYRANSSGLLNCYTYFRWILWLGEDALLPSEPDRLPKKSTRDEELSVSVEEIWEKELVRRTSYLANEDETTDFAFQTERSAPPNCDELIKATLKLLSLIELRVEKAVDEEPAEIFEALNGMRLELAQFDHVKNALFSSIDSTEKRKKLYEEDWKNTEFALEKSKLGDSGADLFLYDFLISKGETRYQKPFSKARAASHFSRYFSSRTNGNSDEIARNEFLPNLRAWLSVKTNGEKFEVNQKSFQLEGDAKRRLLIMDSLSSGPLVPILMNLTNRYYENVINMESYHRQLFYLEVFLGRKVLNRTALSPLRSEMMSLSGRLGSDFTEEQLKEQLVNLTPDDSDIKRKHLPEMVGQVLRYPDTASIGDSKLGGLKPRQLLAIFQALEEKQSGRMRANLIDVNQSEIFSIEHIYPQEPEFWIEELRKWGMSQGLMKERLHVLGNLGVIPSRLNSELSNNSFSDKKKIVSDPKKQFPPLKVNGYWTRETQKRWTYEDIDARSAQLLTQILSYWKFN